MYNSQLTEEIMPLKSWEQRLDHLVNTSPVLRKSAEHFNRFGVSLMTRLKAVSSYEWNCKNSIKSHTVLLRTKGVCLKADEDYGLSKVSVLYKEQGAFHMLLFMDMATVVVLQYSHFTFNGYGYYGCTAVFTRYF
jgi:hypothetical protein